MSSVLSTENPFDFGEFVYEFGDDALHRFNAKWRFGNHRGASVIRGNYTYGGRDGLYELAVLKFPNETNKDWDLDYDTEITDYVIGFLSVDEVNDLLKRISELPKFTTEEDSQEDA